MRFLFGVFRVLIWVINIILLSYFWVMIEANGILLGAIPKVYMFAGMLFFARGECKLFKRRKKKDED